MSPKCRWDVQRSLFSFLDSDHPMNGLEKFWMKRSALCTSACTLQQSTSWINAQQGCPCVYSRGYLPVTFLETSCLIFKTKSDILLMSCFKLSIFFYSFPFFVKIRNYGFVYALIPFLSSPSLNRYRSHICCVHTARCLRQSRHGINIRILDK